MAHMEIINICYFKNLYFIDERDQRLHSLINPRHFGQLVRILECNNTIYDGEATKEWAINLKKIEILQTIMVCWNAKKAITKHFNSLENPYLVYWEKAVSAKWGALGRDVPGRLKRG